MKKVYVEKEDMGRTLDTADWAEEKLRSRSRADPI
jgi:hypothetical protein